MSHSLCNTVKRAIWWVDRRVFGTSGQRALIRIREKTASRDVLANATHQQLVAFEPAYGLLHELCDRWGSDKGSCLEHAERPYPWPPHTYASVYDSLFGHCREHIRLVFECGLGTNNPQIRHNMGLRGRPGASMKVWRDFFPNAEVFGADIDRATLFSDDRIRTFWVDQTDPSAIAGMWAEIGVSGFDLIVDDGLHTFAAGKTLFEGSFGRLKPGGCYVIEDVSVHDLGKYQRLFSELGFPAEFHQLFRNNNPPSDNNLVIVRRR